MGNPLGTGVVKRAGEAQREQIFKKKSVQKTKIGEIPPKTPKKKTDEIDFLPEQV